MFGINLIKNQIKEAAHDAPIEFFKGLGEAVFLLPNGIAEFWDEFTPEEKEVIRKALRKAAIQAATSYVASGGKEVKVTQKF